VSCYVHFHSERIEYRITDASLQAERVRVCPIESAAACAAPGAAAPQPVRDHRQKVGYSCSSQRHCGAASAFNCIRTLFAMRLLVGILTCLSLCQWSQVLATDTPPAAPTAAQTGQSPPPAAAPGTQPAAPDSAPSSSSTSTAASAAKPDKEVPPAVDKQLRAQGFKKEVRNNVLYYCRRETILGSHFEEKSCRTAERIATERTNSRDITERAQIETMQTARP
jgi:hypothetical protein